MSPIKILEITTAVGCPNMCKYCPQELFISRYKGPKELTLDKFKEMLKNIPKDVILNFAGFVEPFKNQSCTDMLLYADKLGYKIKLFTTLQCLSETDANRLKDIKFDRCLVHQLDGKPIKNYPFITERMDEKELAPFVTSRAGNLWDVPVKTGITTCKAIGNCSDGVALPNGDIYCCMDYGLTHKLGNIFETNYDDLHLKDFKLHKLCEKCEYAGVE